jgi:hypothetical protein
MLLNTPNGSKWTMPNCITKETYEEINQINYINLNLENYDKLQRTNPTIDIGKGQPGKELDCRRRRATIELGHHSNNSEGCKA